MEASNPGAPQPPPQQQPPPEPPQSPERVLAPGHAFEAFEWKAVTEEGADWVMEMEITPRVVNSLGALQGGLLATLIDTVGGMALLDGGLTGPRHVTSELQVSFLAAAKVGPVRAVAHILHRGGKSAVVRVDVRDVGADDLFVATGTLRFALMSGGAARSAGGGSADPAG
jgi:uncharacterized protein (TIGR00369 family)